MNIIYNGHDSSISKNKLTLNGLTVESINQSNIQHSYCDVKPTKTNDADYLNDIIQRLFL